MKYLGKITDNKDLVTKEYVDTADATKQNTLVSGTNIKTINNQSLLGSGNITIGGGGSVTPMTDQEIEDAVNTGWSAYPPTPPLGNSVTISLTNPQHASEFSDCVIFGLDTDDPWDEGSVVLGHISSAMGSITVQTDKQYLEVVPQGMSVGVNYSGISTDGTVEWDGVSWGGVIIFIVNNGGSIEIDGIDYDD